MKRKPGRPKKNATAESAPQLTAYSINYPYSNDSAASDKIEAHAFDIQGNGDLILTRDGETVAAFRVWNSIQKRELPAIPAILANVSTVTADAEPQGYQSFANAA